MAKKLAITEDLAKEVLRVVDKGLSCGLGDYEYDPETNMRKGIPGAICVEAAVCYALGEPHGDEPSCVAPCVKYVKVAINDLDNIWGDDNKARARDLRRLAIAQLGSKGEVNGRQFEKAVFDLVWNSFYQPKIDKHIEELKKASAKKDFETLKTLTSELTCLLGEFSGDLDPVELLKKGIEECVIPSNRKTIQKLCDDIVQIMVKLKSPGTQYLYLTEKPKKVTRKRK